MRRLNFAFLAALLLQKLWDRITILSKPKSVIFLKVMDNAMKAKRLSDAVNYYFLQQVSILLLVPNDQAAQYVDQLLWRLPENSFLPHQITQETTNELIAISTAQSNLNHAQTLINLCPTACSIADQFITIIELLDHTSVEKLQLSQQRQAAYRSLGYAIQER